MKLFRILFGLVALLLLAAGCASRNVSQAPHFDSLAIVGSPKFVDQVERALTLLKFQSPESYHEVTNYVGIIQEDEHSGMEAEHQPPIFQLNDRSAFYSVTWCAGVIVHDATHSKLYHDYHALHRGTVPAETWTGHAAERICLDQQLRTLTEIGAPQRELEYFKTLTPDYADVPYRKRNW